MKDVWMGSLAAQGEYNPEEGAFQAGIRATPWFDEFKAKYGEEPNLEDPNYDYRAAWKAGARPTVRDPGDNLLHWDSRFKGENHPNRYVGGVDTKTGQKIGDLANAFDVPGEQSTNVGWANRLGEILTTRPQYDEQTVLHKTASPLVNITEGDIGRATEAAMAVSGGGMKVETPKGIRAYHSSPHDFDKFDLAKIGSGEGAQVYGHGLYFAESPAVSGQGGQYWQQFANYKNAPFKKDPVESIATVALQKTGVNREKAIEYLLEKPWDIHPSQYDKAIALLKSDKPIGPRTYEVNINADPAHMLDWDKAIGQQPHVIDALKQRGYKDAPWPYGDKLISYEPGGMLLDPKDSGESVYRSLSKVGGVHANDRVFDKAKATQALQESGIPGIKYLDQGSRNATPVLKTDRAGNVISSEYPPPTSNFVIFDPGIIDIMKKYVVPGAIGAGGMGALAAQDEYRQ